MRTLLRFVPALCLTGLLTSNAVAQPPSVEFNGTTFYKVLSTDSALDTGDEVCAAVGMTCTGYTEPTDAVCLLFHPGVTRVSNSSGDYSGVYCDGPPQGGICATEFNTCHTCSGCSPGVQCSEAIGGLYREMYVECVGTDSDGDGVFDPVDNCPSDANADQANNDSDALGDVCDDDDDNDGVVDLVDNCPIDANLDQADDDFDGLGNACDVVFDGNVVVVAIQDLVVSDVETIKTLNVSGGNGMISKLTGQGGVLRKTANAVEAHDAGLINDATYVGELTAAQKEEDSYKKQVSTSTKMPAAEAEELLTNSAKRMLAIDNLKEQL